MTSNKTGGLIDLLFATMKIIKENFRSQSVADISFGQLKALHYIESKNSPNMKEIADELGITPPSVTALVDPFVLHGLVKRIYDNKDRRIVKLTLTAKGKAYLDEHYKNMTEKMEKLISVLSERQIANFKEILEIILKHAKQSSS